MLYDVIVIGSGASAVHAAWPCVEQGLQVLMLDVALQDDVYEKKIPSTSFEEIRHQDLTQHQYFLGNQMEGVPFGAIRVGAQLTPPRQYLSQIPQMAPYLKDGKNTEFNGMLSYALGGLGSGWGAASPCYTDEDLSGWPISRADLQTHYEKVAQRVGICGSSEDDLKDFFGPLNSLLPPSKIDSNAKAILRNYQKRRNSLNKSGFHLGMSRLAMVTKKFRNRGPARYLDMEFWSDKDKAVYRPRYTVEELQEFSNFTLANGRIALKISEGSPKKVSCINIYSQEHEGFTGGKVIVAAGAIGTGRLVLNSLELTETPLPLLSNPYTYFPCLVWSTLGKNIQDKRHSLTQLMSYYQDPKSSDPVSQAQIYSYRSLLAFKLVKESPLPYRESIKLMRMLQSHFVIVGIHHEDSPTKNKKLYLDALGDISSGETIVEYKRSSEEDQLRRRTEKKLMRNFYKLGCIPLKRIDTGDGSSIHYAGTLPMSCEEKPLTTRADGSLRDIDGVYIADGSVFPNLPAKGLTFTCMANANRVGEMVAAKCKD